MRHGLHAAVPLALVMIVAVACGGSAAPSSPAPASPQASPQATATATATATAAPSLAPSPSTAANALHLVVIGDSIPFADFCPGCTGFVEQYAKALEKSTGRPVETANRSRNDSAGLAEIDVQVNGEPELRSQLKDADVVIVSIGANNALPDANTHASMAARYHRDWGCVGDMGDSLETFTAWLLATTPACRQATRDAYATLYDRIYPTIARLRAGKPTTLIAVNAYNGNFHGSDFMQAGLPPATLSRLWPLMTEIYDRWDQMECDRATKAGFVCVDLYHAFNGPKGDQAIGLLSVDGAHPSQAGNDLIAGLLEKVKLVPTGQ
ncbi:MAG: SGNH/GDSL hydrolase family protein [Chloroflexota bacterium]